MRNAETVLSVIQDRGYQGLPLDDVMRQLYNPNLYLKRVQPHLQKRWSDDARSDSGDCRRDVHEKD